MRLAPSRVALLAATVLAGVSRCASSPRIDSELAAERVRSAVTSEQPQAEVRRITTPAPTEIGDLQFWYWGSRTGPVAWVALYKGTVVSKSP